MNARLMPPSRLARTTVLRSRSDERLAELVRHGSAAAFETIVHRYRRSLLSHCAQVLGEADAEEAVQDALVNAHAALNGGAEVRSLRSWLHAVAHNAALGALRRRAARPEWPQEGCADRLRQPSPEPAQAELQAVVEAVRSLPPRQRDAIVMRELEGRSYEEIAGRLGTTDGAVRQLLNRARRSMREGLGALIPAASLLRWALAAGDGSGAWGVLTLGAGSAVAAKLTGAAVLSAVSVITMLPAPPTVGVPASSGPDRGKAPAAVVATGPHSHATALPAVRAARSSGPGHIALSATGHVSRASAAHAAPRGGAGQLSVVQQGPGLRWGGAGRYAGVTEPTVGFQAGQRQTGSPAAAGAGSEGEPGPAGQPSSPRVQVSSGGTAWLRRQLSPGQPG